MTPPPNPPIEPGSGEDFLTPIHKGLRGMIYALADRLQSTDLADPAAAAPMVAQLRHELAGPRPTACVVCLLHAHTGGEDIFAFPGVRTFDPDLIDGLRREHAEIEAKIRTVTRLGEELADASAPPARGRAGGRLLRAANDLFATYLAHLNREEEELVPLLQQRLSGPEIVALGDAMERALRPDRRAELHRWILRSLDPPELAAWLREQRRRGPPGEFAELLAEGATLVEPERWALACARAGTHRSAVGPSADAGSTS